MTQFWSNSKARVQNFMDIYPILNVYNSKFPENWGYSVISKMTHF